MDPEVWNQAASINQTILSPGLPPPPTAALSCVLLSPGAAPVVLSLSNVVCFGLCFYFLFLLLFGYITPLLLTFMVLHLNNHNQLKHLDFI